ncbi:abscission/NoCut checkpoint regulator [Eupeodes corollae]|uniref:abscission/NoCut checkpoint regulator n=1 Tax=Eupeodes corollae TaxID=290404 RepID=UPI0024935477|nr:abscission/NoCut checkpoint regulator [Eupeodes corollae]
MSCYACMRKYGIFCKESGCANCGYSFCLKCLKNEIEVPRKNNQKLKVCLRCFETLKAVGATNSNKDSALNSTKLNTKLEPNEIFQITDPINSLGPVLEPISSTSNATQSKNTDSDEITDNLDLEIQRRLKGLKGNGDDNLDEESLRLRLCNLQGFKPKDYSKKDILLSTDKRTEQEKINDLLKQFVEEKDIDSNVAGGGTTNDPITDIERRLAALRDSDPSDMTKKPTTDANTPSDNEEDDETMLKNIIQRYVDEVRLPTASGSDALLTEEPLQPVATTHPNSTEATEELPWCTICNEDAVLRCQSCDGDLFCRNCFNECHQDDEEWRGHATQPYSKPPTFKEDHF